MFVCVCVYRWDSPMFTVLPGDLPLYEDIYSALFLTRPPPPNQSTQTQPLSPTNFLYELDRSTQVHTHTYLYTVHVHTHSHIYTHTHTYIHLTKHYNTKIITLILG